MELSSSQEFIRALKAPKDPPRPGGALKVDLARAAWELESLFIPSKAEVIVEWALQVLKSSDVLDVKMWSLLDDILSKTSSPAWLNGVVNRIAVLPVFTSLLHAVGIRLRSVTDALEPALFTSATRVARILLPLASLKTSCDVVAGSFWEVLGLFSSPDVPDVHLVPILDLCEVVVSTLETSFANYSNKKKIATHLVDHHLNSWLQPLNPDSTLAKFRHRLFDVCSLVVFSPEHTRAIFQHHPDPHPVLIATSFSPRVFAAYVSALRTHKLLVFLDQGGSGLPKRIRNAAREVFVRAVAKREWSVVAQLARYAEELQIVDDDWAEEFGALAESAVQALDNKWSEEQARIAIHICETLGCILRCHVHVVEPILGRLLSGLCDAPPSVLPAARSVLELVLDYHSKTRTLNVFLPQLANALASGEYQASCTGPVFEPTFAARLRRSVSAFITPGQILPCTQTLLSEARFIPEPPRKKRRSSARGSNANESAVRLGLVSRLLVDILMSLPVRTLKGDVVELLRRSVDEFDAGLGLVDPCSWADEVALAAVLRIRYALRQARCPVRTRRVLSMEEAKAEDDLLLRLVEDDARSAELVTEAVRVLTQGERSREHISSVWSRALARVRRDAAQQHSSWNGSLAHLENRAWFPLLFLLFDRQLHLIEFSMNADQLGIILDILVHMNRNLDRSDGITAAHLFNKTISLAQFWELPNLRKALNEKITLDTSSLERVDLHKALKALRKGKQSKHTGSHEPAISLYHIAALAPPDYLDRPAKAALLARAACADVLATRAVDRSIVRVVLRQLSSGSGVLPEEYVRYLLDPLLQSIAEAYSSSSADDTLSVLGASFRVYARLARDSDASSDLVAVLQSIETLELFELPRWEDPAAAVSIRATLTCLDTIVETWGKSSTPPTTHSRLPDTIRTCVVKILDQIRNRVEHPGQVTDLLIEAARTLAACEHWFGRDATRASRRARIFLRTLLEQNSVATEALLRLLTEEIQNADEDVRLLLAAFTLNARAHGSDVLRAENSFGEACRRINLEQHGTLTNEITALLQEPEPDHVYRVSTIRMASLALRFAPEGTSKARRRTTTAVLHALGRLPQLSVFQEACAVFIAEICNERANALTAPDMTAIWILLDRATTSPDDVAHRVYSSTVSSLNSLVRFRRDLLTPTLAQLSALLARLIRAQRLRTPYAIGGPQHDVNQATELARLLVGLSTKTLVRPNNSKSEQTAKAESLARPFARHAPYVLVAYAESAADMSAAVRHALKPGLFALCAMCGVPARDMIMVTMLDTVEKEVFGGVWREWEAQKYTGKG